MKNDILKKTKEYLNKRKLNKDFKEKLKKLKERDPFIYKNF